MPMVAESEERSLAFRPHAHLAVFVNLDANHVWPATNRTVLDVLLARSRRQIDGYDDLLAAGVTDVARLILHSVSSLVTDKSNDGIGVVDVPILPVRPYAQAIHGSRFDLIERAGHRPEVERPEAFVDRVVAFLKE